MCACVRAASECVAWHGCTPGVQMPKCVPAVQAAMREKEAKDCHIIARDVVAGLVGAACIYAEHVP